jgi:hypothetical protein
MDVTIETVDSNDNSDNEDIINKKNTKILNIMTDEDILKKAEEIKQKRIGEQKKNDEKLFEEFTESFIKLYDENISLRKTIKANSIKMDKLKLDYSKICKHSKYVKGDKLYYSDGAICTDCKYCYKKLIHSNIIIFEY